MALLKNTIFVALLLLFSLRFTKSQEASWGDWGETTVTETTTTTEAWEEEITEETTSTEAWEEAVTAWEETTTETTTTEETTITEEAVIIEEEETIEEGSSGECPKFIEETEVNGHWMTFHPCCVSSQTACSSSFEPVCIEELRCEADHCRRHYETVTNVCLACKGQGTWMYSVGECPWEKNVF